MPSAQLLSELTSAVRRTDPLLAYPDEWSAVLGDLALETVLKRRGGLPRLSAAMDGALGAEPLRVCYLGGSVTEQRAGYRPRVTRWLEATARAGVRVEEVPAFCGNCGSKVLAFMVADWVIARRPHLVFVELVRTIMHDRQHCRQPPPRVQL